MFTLGIFGDILFAQKFYYTKPKIMIVSEVKKT